jgi:early secretory antigenic target protein ESAT-6
MSEIQVNVDGLHAGASGIQTTFRSLQSTLEGLEQQLQPMVTSWTGEARDAYFAQKKKWDQASEAMAAVLNQMGQVAGQSGDAYRRAEQANIGRWGG